MSASLDAALRLAAAGRAVLPLYEPREGVGCSCSRGESCGSTGKHPRTLRGFQDATTDARTIREWFGRWRLANLGVRTGDGLAVLDVDFRDGGESTLAAYLENTNSKLPHTAEVLTGDGRHLYLAAPRGIRSRRLGPGLDFKAEGGYVVAPPSIHASGRQYTWHPDRALGDVALAELPAWLDTRGSEGRSRVPAGEWARVAREGFTRGERNVGAARYAGHLIARLELEEAWELLAAWNATRNRPPLDEPELERVFLSIAERELRPRTRSRK